MKPGHVLVLRGVAKFIMDSECDVGNFVDNLQMEGAITADDNDRVSRANPRSERCKVLFLDILPSKEDQVMDLLTETIKNSGMDMVYDLHMRLLKTGVSDEDAATFPHCSAVFSKFPKARITLKQRWNRGAGMRNILFTGREEELDRVTKALKRDCSKDIGAICVTGSGGIGKTAIALEFSYREERHFTFLAWLKADSPGRFLEELEALGEVLGVPTRPNKKDSPTSAQDIEAVKHVLASNPGWLLVLDDLSEDAFETLDECLPKSGGSVLITSRVQILASWLSRVRVLELPEATLLLGKVIGESEKPTDFELLKEELADVKLGKLPLAIMHAGSYIKQLECTLSSYLELFEESAEIINQQLRGVKFDGPMQVLTSWNLTMTHLRKISEDTFRFLSICCVLATVIENELINAAPMFKEDSDRETKMRVMSAKLLLLSFSMLDPLEGGMKIHAIVQEAVLFRSSNEEKERGFFNGAMITKVCFDLTNEGNPEPFRNCFGHCDSLLRKFHQQWADQVGSDSPSILKDTFTGAMDGFCQSISKLGIKISAKFLDRLSRTGALLFGVSPRGAVVMNNIALGFRIHGNYAKEGEMLQAALEIEQSHYGTDHIEVGKTLNNLGVCCGDMGNYQKEKELLEMALKIKESYCGEDDVEVAKTLVNLGSCYGDLGHHLMEQKVLERALRLKEAFYGGNHIEVAMTLNNLGNCYGNLGEQRKKREVLQRALEIKEQFYGSDHFELGTTLNNLAMCHGALGDHDKEKEMLERALEIYKSFFDGNHVVLGDTLINLSNCYGAFGNQHGKIEMLQKALRIYQSFYGSSHVKVAIALRNLGIAHHCLKMYPESIASLKRAIEIFEQGCPPLELCRAYSAISQCLVEYALLSIPFNRNMLFEAREFFQNEGALSRHCERSSPVIFSHRIAYNSSKLAEVNSLLAICSTYEQFNESLFRCFLIYGL